MMNPVKGRLTEVRVYIFGNGNVDFATFSMCYLPVLESLDLSCCEFLVCDFRGADTLAMEWLKTRTSAVTVFHMGGGPRYLPDKYRTKVGAWKLIGGFVNDAERDGVAIEACTHFIAVDGNSRSDRKSGTQRNIERCSGLGKVPLSMGGIPGEEGGG
jgi:hypothetical protein